jgi:hypothetical protein
MNHHETITLAEQHRHELLADAAATRSGGRGGSRPGHTVRSLFSRNRRPT